MIGRRDPGLGPSLVQPKKPGVGLVILRWRHELAIAATVLSVFGFAAKSFGVGQAILGAAGLAAAGCVACMSPKVRRLAVARFWLIATPHRVRTCFARAWIYNERGQIPAVLRAAAAPWGERVLLWSRAGIGFADIESATDLLATACFATDVIANRNPRHAHIVYLDVIRWPERQIGAGAIPEAAVDPDTSGGRSGPQRPNLHGLPGNDWQDAA